MGIEIYTPVDSQRWNDLIYRSINGTLYHSWEWLKIVEKHSGYKLFTLVYFDDVDNKPFGAFPLFFRQQLGVKMVFSPPPGCAITLGPVLISKGYKQHKFELVHLEFQSAVERFIQQLGADYIYFVTSPGLMDIRPYSWAHYNVKPLYTYKIDLSQGEERVLRNMSDHIRKDVNRAKKNQIRVVESDKTEDIDQVYASLKRRYAEQRLSFPVKREYMRDLFQEFKNSALVIYLAINGEKILGSTICSRYRDTVTALIGGARNSSDDLDVTALIKWEAISHAINNGYRYFELAGANTRNLCNSKAMYSPSPAIYFEMKKRNLVGSLAENLYLAMQHKYF
jgi:hypothetical protein